MWNKFKERSIEGFVGLTIALVVLHLMSWFLNEPAGDLVGWMALGIAASTSMSKS